MGNQAATTAPAEAAGAGSIAGGTSPSHEVPKLQLVSSPKREMILAATLEEVGASGYDATSVRMVLNRCGVYRQAFYDNFADKDECFAAAYDRGVAELEARVARAAASEQGWIGQLRAGLTALLEYLDDNSDIGRALFVEVHAAGAGSLARRAEAMKAATAVVDRAREQAELADSPPGIAAEGVVAGIHAVLHSRLSTGASNGFRQLLPDFMYFAVLPYFGAEAAGAEMRAARAS